MAKVRLPARPLPPLRLEVLPAAASDLDGLPTDDVNTAFWATVEQLRSDQDYLERLLLDFYGEERGDRWRAPLGVRQVREFGVDRGRDIWRFKIWKLENSGLRFRFFYGYFPSARLLVVLAVDGRGDDTYDPASEMVRRICADYERLSQKYD